MPPHFQAGLQRLSRADLLPAASPGLPRGTQAGLRPGATAARGLPASPGAASLHASAVLDASGMRDFAGSYVAVDHRRRQEADTQRVCKTADGLWRPAAYEHHQAGQQQWAGHGETGAPPSSLRAAEGAGSAPAQGGAARTSRSAQAARGSQGEQPASEPGPTWSDDRRQAQWQDVAHRVRPGSDRHRRRPRTASRPAGAVAANGRTFRQMQISWPASASSAVSSRIWASRPLRIWSGRPWARASRCAPRQGHADMAL